MNFYPPEQPNGWPPLHITGLTRQMMNQDCQELNKVQFADLLREVASYVDPLAAKGIKKISDVNSKGFLVDKASIILDILLGCDATASPDEKLTSGENLRILVATKQADMLAILIDIMNGQARFAHDITLALAIKRQLEAKRKRLPAKGEIKTRMLKVGCRLKDGDNTGWRRLWEDAGLKYLPKAKPQRGKSKHGQK